MFLTFHFSAQGSEPVVACSPVTGRVYYVIKSGDHLANILRDFEVGLPLWDAERGYIYKVSKLNHLQNPNLIHPGKTLDLPFACEEKLLKFEVTQTNLGREVNLKSNRVTASDAKTEVQEVPVQPQVSVQAQDFQAYSRLRASGTYDFHRIDSESSSSSSSAFLLSEPSLGLNLSWGQVWSEKFSTEFSVSQASVLMRDASSGTLEGGNKTLGKIGFGFEYSLLPNLLLKLDSTYGNQLFARAISAGTATVDSVYVSRIGVSVIPTLIQKGALSLDLQIGYFQVLPTSTSDYSVKTGEGYILAPGLRHKLKNMQLELDLKYEDLRQNSSISSQQNKQVGIQFGISFEVGK